MTQKLGIEDLRFDWREAIEELQPDIVAITTPGKPHREMAEFAAQHGCHIASEKPLALNGTDAEAILVAVEKAGVKHAYAATGCYSPQFAVVRDLLATGIIGKVQEFEHICNFNFSNYLPYFWFYRLNDGGGCLFQVFTHMASHIRRITGGEFRAATGEARRIIERAPVVQTLHDWRDFLHTKIDPEVADAGEWKEIDADTGYVVLAQLQMPADYTISGIFRLSWRAVSGVPNHLTLYGTSGTIQLTGSGWPEQIRHYSNESQTWQDIPVSGPAVGSVGQSLTRERIQWGQLYREFVADVRGEGYAGYPTFREGWIDNQIIEIVHKGSGMTTLKRVSVSAS
jgi:predicted dehydrogenase